MKMRNTIWISCMILISIIPAVFAALDCSISTTCSYHEIFRMNALTNAHASLAGDTNYSYIACCRDTDILDVELNPDNCSDATLFRLIKAANSNAAIPSYTDYPYQVCMSADDAIITCGIKGACSANESCVATLTAGTSNLHIGDCSAPYPQKVCCELSYAKKENGESCSNDDDCLSGDCGKRPDGTGMCIPSSAGCLNMGNMTVPVGTKLCYNNDAYLCSADDFWEMDDCYTNCGYYNPVDICAAGICQGCPTSCTDDIECTDIATCSENECSLKSLQHPAELNMDIPNVLISEQRTLYDYFNLYDYFIDPDHDTLSFGYSLTGGGLDISINNKGDVSFSAEDDAEGKRGVIFSAYDGFYTTYSNNVTIEIFPIGFSYRLGQEIEETERITRIAQSECFVLDKFGNKVKCSFELKVWE